MLFGFSRPASRRTFTAFRGYGRASLLLLASAVTFAYGDRPALRGVDVWFAAGAVTCTGTPKS